MAEVQLRHAFQSVRADGSDPSQIQPSQWNAQHVITVNPQRLVGRDRVGAGVAEEIGLQSGQLQFDGNQVIRLADSGVTAGTYTVPTLTVDAKGRITSVTTGPDLDAITAAAEASALAAASSETAAETAETNAEAAQVAAEAAAAAISGFETAQILVAASAAGFTAERVATNTTTITWDFGTAAQGKANVVTSGLNASELLTLIKTVDGASSGLDADLLDGQSSAAFQPVDTTLTALAGVSTAADKLIYATGSDTFTTTDLTSYGRTLIALADETALEALLDTLPNLTSIQGVAFTFGAYAATILNNANEAAFKAAVNLEIGVDVQAFDTDLTTWAGLTPSANFQTLVPHTFAQMRADLDLEAGTDFYSISAANAAFQPIDADLTSIAALTTTAAGRSMLTFTDPNANAVLYWDDSAGAVQSLTLDDTLEFSGDNLQRAALTGDVTASAGSNSTTIPNNTVTYAKMQDVAATSRVLGRITTGSGDVEELTGPNLGTIMFPASGAYTPAVTASVGTFTSVAATGRFLTVGKFTWVSMTITITTNGTAAGSVEATLPVAATSTASTHAVLAGRATQASGKMLQGRLLASGTSVSIFNYDNTYPGATGEILLMSGWYESA